MLTSLVWTGAVFAGSGDAAISTVELLAYGTMEASEVELAKMPSSDHPRVDRIKGVRFTHNTQRIIAAPAANFGISYRVNSSDVSSSIDVIHTLIFPEGGLQDTAGYHYDRATDRQTIEIGKPVAFGYGFDGEWERVPGQWVFQVWYQDARILQKTFTVLPELPPGGN
jgi:hypothetical protein